MSQKYSALNIPPPGPRGVPGKQVSLLMCVTVNVVVVIDFVNFPLKPYHLVVIMVLRRTIWGTTELF